MPKKQKSKKFIRKHQTGSRSVAPTAVAPQLVPSTTSLFSAALTKTKVNRPLLKLDTIDSVRPLRSNRLQELQQLQPWIGVGYFLISLVAMLGSLYFSTFGDIVANIAHGTLFDPQNGFTPCTLCWFARILMYPMVLFSYVAIAKKDKHFTDYLLPLTTLGIFLEIYHYALQKLPIHSVFGCSLEAPCSALQVNYFGFITIPFLAGVAFILLTVLGALNTYINWKTEHQ